MTQLVGNWSANSATVAVAARLEGPQDGLVSLGHHLRLGNYYLWYR